MLVAVQLSVLGLYLPPVFKRRYALVAHPRRSFHCRSRLPCDSIGQRARWSVLVAIQLSVLGLYLPPVFKSCCCHSIRPRRSFHCRSTLPCGLARAAGALVVLVAVQLSVLGLYLPPVFKALLKSTKSAPNDHFTAGPHCRVIGSGSGRVGGAGGCPSIRAGIVSPASVQSQGLTGIVHPRRSFHCRSTLPCDQPRADGRVVCWWLSNCPCWDCISRRCSHSRRLSIRPRRSFHCRSTLPCETTRAVGALVSAGGCPTIGAGIVSAASV